MKRLLWIFAVTAMLTVILASHVSFAAPDTVRRTISIWSNGTRLSADMFFPGDAGPEKPYPTVVMSHGWGGLRAHLNANYAPLIASAGFIVVTFDYRGWGDSDSRMVVLGPEPAPDGNGRALVKARLVRKVVDPIDQVEDITSVLDYLMGEPMVDKERIGLWGTSFSGGHVVRVAARDSRVRAIVAQVGFMGGDWQADTLAKGRRRAVEKARGDIDPIPKDIDRIQGLRGTPDLARMVNYRPIDDAADVRVPTLIIDVEEEELFDRMKNGHAVFDVIQANGIAAYKAFPGKHYDIYNTHRDAATQLAIDWFITHLSEN